MTLFEVARELADRLVAHLPARRRTAGRPVHGGTSRFPRGPELARPVLFYEYFHGDNGAGLGASHQTGWTGVVRSLIQLFGHLDPAEVLEHGGRPVTRQYLREIPEEDEVLAG